MNYNEMTERAHSNAVKHGFWDKKHSNEHCLMLVITEIAEMVEADRCGKHPFEPKHHKDACMRLVGNVQWDKIGFDNSFVAHIKDTVEDEMADVAIRLFDLAGALGIDFDKMNPCRYYRAFAKFSFTENAFALCKGLSRDVIGIEKRIQFGIFYIREWAKSLDIDLDWHIAQKMRYNENRPIRHNKRY